MGPLIAVLVWGLVWGFATQAVITNKGYYQNWFWWGFFFGLIAMIVALSKPNAQTNVSTAAPEWMSHGHNNQLLDAGGWTCSCGRVNPSYTGTCACGKTKQQALESVQEQAKEKATDEEIAKLEKVKAYKEFLDSGVITQEEYEAKRKEILG